MEIQEVEGRRVSQFRAPSGVPRMVWNTLLTGTPILGILYILNVHTRFDLSIYPEQYTGFFLGAMLTLVFIGIPATASAPRDRLPWYDWVLGAMSLASGLYIAVYYPSIATLLGYVTPDRVVFGAISIVVILEAVRRSIGWILVVIVCVFLAYAYLAPFLPGPLHATPTSTPDLINYLYLDANNGLRLIEISATIAFAFMLFGEVLLKFGGSTLINEFVMGVFGRYRGGPAKAAVVASSLVGTMSGGAATNVMLTGVVTIPLMIRTGYSPVAAGAVEAVASTGGQIMPPVMSVAAFLIADNLGMPYGEVAFAAALPAVLYYLGVFAQVDLAAARDGRAGVPASQLPSVRQSLRRGWIMLPIFGFMVYMILILGYDAGIAGIYSVGVAMALLLFLKESRTRLLSRVVGALKGTARSLISITAVLGAAGLIVGVTNITGLGFNMALSLTRVGSHGLFLLLFLSAGVCVVLGMGMPTVAAYTLVAVLVAPAIVKLGALPLAAHLFILYFAVVSNITPPVALACYAASVISGASPNPIGWAAMRLATAAYVVPFLFLYSNALLLRGTTGEVVVSAVTAVLGMYFMSAGIVGYLVGRLDAPRRWVAFVAGLALLVPVKEASHVGWIINGAGLVAAVMLATIAWRASGRRADAPS